jgi:hypothetical protein
MACTDGRDDVKAGAFYSVLLAAAANLIFCLEPDFIAPPKDCQYYKDVEAVLGRLSRPWDLHHGVGGKADAA